MSVKRVQGVFPSTQGEVSFPTGEWTLLFIFPKAFTQGCTLEAADFTRLYKDFSRVGVRVLGLSPDPLERLERFAKKLGSPFPFIPDPEKGLIRTLGAWGVKKLYGREVEGVLRSTFLLNPRGEVVRAWKNVRAKGHAERVLEEVKSIVNA